MWGRGGKGQTRGVFWVCLTLRTCWVFSPLGLHHLVVVPRDITGPLPLSYIYVCVCVCVCVCVDDIYKEVRKTSHSDN
jgi:hypothetical protein